MSQPHLRQLFLRAMQDELDANVHKGDWDALRLDTNQAINWITEHASKLFADLAGGADPAKVREHCADLANFAMKVDECFGPANPDPKNITDHVRMMPVPPILKRR